MSRIDLTILIQKKKLREREEKIQFGNGEILDGRE